MPAKQKTSNKEARPLFFLNLWHYAVHGPWGHKAEYTKEFAKKKDPTAARATRSWPRCSAVLTRASVACSQARRTWARGKHHRHFYSDNGGNVSSNTPEGRRAKTVKKGNPVFQAQLADWRKWAGEQPPTNNAPLRDGKGSLYEGGNRVPLMIRWPGKVPAGMTTEAIVHAYDLYPTLLDLLGLPKPAHQTMDGISFAPVLSDPAAKLPQRSIIIAAQNGCSIRQGDWKLYRDYKEPAFELYNLKDDLSESTDLIGKYADKAKELEKLLMEHFAATTGIPRVLKRP